MHRHFNSYMYTSNWWLKITYKHSNTCLHESLRDSCRLVLVLIIGRFKCTDAPCFKYGIPFSMYSCGRVPKGQDSIHLVAEKQVICSVEDGSLLEAALCRLAVYYVFMFNYPMGLNNFYLYLQKCILDIQDGRKLPSSVLAFVNELQSTSV